MSPRIELGIIILHAANLCRYRQVLQQFAHRSRAYFVPGASAFRLESQLYSMETAKPAQNPRPNP